MGNMPILKIDYANTSDIDQIRIANQYLNNEVSRLKAALKESRSTVYQQQRTISKQAVTVKELSRRIMGILERGKVMLNKDNITFVQAFGMKCTEKSILTHLRTFLNCEPTWDRLNADTLQRFSTWLRRSAKTQRGTLLSDSTACTYIAQLRVVMKYGYSDSADSSNALKTSRPASKKKVWLRPSDLRQLVEYTPTDIEENRTRCTFLICAITGCRVSDAPTLKIENIDGETLRYIPIKTKHQECYIKLSVDGKMLLQELIKEALIIGYSENNLALKKIFRDLSFIQKVAIGTPNKPEMIELCEGISFHTARRSFATNLYRYSQLNERDIATAMGHASFSQTYNTYVADKSNVSDEEKIKNRDSIFAF